MADILRTSPVSELPNKISLGAGVFKLSEDRTSDQKNELMKEFEYDPASGQFYKRMGSRYIEWVEIAGKDDD